MERDFNRKATRGRKRHARYMEDHTAGTEPVANAALDPRVTKPQCLEEPPAEATHAPKPPPVQPAAFADDEILPVFEADLDLPHLSVAVISTAAGQQSPVAPLRFNGAWTELPAQNKSFAFQREQSLFNLCQR